MFIFKAIHKLLLDSDFGDETAFGLTSLLHQKSYVKQALKNGTCLNIYQWVNEILTIGYDGASFKPNEYDCLLPATTGHDMKLHAFASMSGKAFSMSGISE